LQGDDALFKVYDPCDNESKSNDHILTLDYSPRKQEAQGNEQSQSYRWSWVVSEKASIWARKL